MSIVITNTMWLVSLNVLLLVTVASLSDAFLSTAKFNEKIELTRNYKARNVRYAYYTQWRDHFNSSDFTTFDQKIYINDVHYNLFAPVFIFVSDQLSEFEYWLENSFVSQINEEQFGVVYGIEPRFYGSSRPTENVSNENLRFLTTDQTLADIADFARFLQLELRENKYILFGYGDGAELATLAHQTYPDLFDGVWAVAAPTDIKLNFADYFGDLQDTLLDYNRPCASIIGGGLEELDALVVAGDIDRIHELFGFQNRIDLDNSKDVSLLFYTLPFLLTSKIEYGTQTDLTNLCIDLLDNFSQGLSAVEAIAREVISITQYTNPSWDDSIRLLRGTGWNTLAVESGQRQFWYTSCTERSFFRTSTYFPEPVRSRFLLNFFFDLCFEVFGIVATDVELGNLESNQKFSLNPNLQNVIFTYGGLDPFRLVGQATDLNVWSPAEVIPGFGKTYELIGFLPQQYLTAEMIAVRARVRSHILSIINQ